MAAGPSLFAYVGSDPLSYVDPLGLQAENERDLLEPIDVAGPLQGANYRQTLARIRQYDPDFVDPVASRGEANYTRDDVERLEELLREKGMEGCRAPSSQRPSKTPNTGEPGTTYKNPGSGRQRTYGPDGKPLFDVDYDHDHGQGVPHRHDWTDGVRGPGVPFNPNGGN